MPFVSKAEQRFAHAHPEKFGGEKGLKEWDSATDFTNLPERAHPLKSGQWMKDKPKHEAHIRLHAGN